MKSTEQNNKIELKISGELCSKSNSRRIVNFGGHPKIIKSAKALAYEQSALMQIKTQLRAHREFITMKNYVCIEVHSWYGSRRPDLDVSLLQDILEKAGVYENDRQVAEIHAYKYRNVKDPKVIVRIHELTESEMSNSGLLK